MRYWQKDQPLNNGKYIVEQLLGSGGYGVTYKVRDAKTNHFFAIKTLNNQRQQQENFKELQDKLINEIIAIAQCRHRNIVQVYPQVFSEDELLCMVMDYIEGQDLAEYLDTTGKFSEPDAINLILQVGEALETVHRQGFLHRDIKPANILLKESDSSPVLIDFGLAREYNPQSLRSMTDAKTECFAPIEQYQENDNFGNFGAWTDIYALAATLYVLVTAKLPLSSTFRGYAPLPAPKQLNPDISYRLNEAILQGMQLAPENRPQLVRDWLEMLQPTKVELIPDVKSLRETSEITGRSTFGGDLQTTPTQNQNISPTYIQEIELKKIQDKIEESLANQNLANNNFNLYSQLGDLLKNKQWKQADNETIQILLTLTKRKKYGSLRDRDIENIPCIDLLKIDLLWLEASNNNFGFTVQRYIWQKKLGFELASKQFNNSENLREFSNFVGWYTNDELLKNRNCYQFSLDSPPGHLPSLRFPCSEFPEMNWWQSWKRIFRSLLMQTDKCRSH
jgi:eukaryotic-like serine/threonine-protein kinase